MAVPEFFDRVLETATTTGTGTFTLLGAETGYRTYGSVYSNGNDAVYLAWNRNFPSEWEIGIGTWSTGGTLTRTTVIASSNSGSAVSFSTGTKEVMVPFPGGKANLPKVTIYDIPEESTPYSHSLSPWTKMVSGFTKSGGGSGGGGRQGAAGTARGGGSGGGGGASATFRVIRSTLPSSTLSVLVANTRAGGAGASTTSTNGSPGLNGGTTSISCSGTILCSAAPGLAGAGGIAGVSTGAAANGNGGSGGNGYTPATAGGNGTSGGAGGGGGGGGVSNSGNLAGADGGGGIYSDYAVGAAGAAGTTTGAGGNGGNATIPESGGGGGGGGGAASKGGNGGNYGGGGGGGGGSTNGTKAGDGGSGAQGIAVIVEE